jgi:hypothetical protein
MGLPAKHVDRMSVLLPPMLGPVISMARELPNPSATSLGTTTLVAVLSVRQGCLTSFRSMTQPSPSELSGTNSGRHVGPPGSRCTFPVSLILI